MASAGTVPSASRPGRAWWPGATANAAGCWRWGGEGDSWLAAGLRNILRSFQEGAVFMPRLVFQENPMTSQSGISLGTGGA